MEQIQISQEWEKARAILNAWERQTKDYSHGQSPGPEAGDGGACEMVSWWVTLVTFLKEIIFVWWLLCNYHIFLYFLGPKVKFFNQKLFKFL